jgi:uncharacterized DUF497 family protein
MVDEVLFEWDEVKSAKALRERGFGFDYASQIFAGEVLVEEDRRYGYGEKRFLAIGQVEEELLVVIYTRRDKRRRIISTRRANRRERNDYRKAFPP